MISRCIKAIAAWVSSGFGSGYAVMAPGTFGSGAALMLWWLLFGIGALSTPVAQLMLISVTIVVGTVVVGVCVKGESVVDPQWIVIDEWAGLFIALFGLAPSQWGLALVGFVAFRIFDATKVGPVGWAERLPREYGIMADDIVAGALAAGVVWGVRLACSL
jgi:phosphatidylglycerophosphatase A